jgi:hypothetical protein
MSWKLNKVEIAQNKRIDGSPLKAGDWWFCTWYLDSAEDVPFYMGECYVKNWYGKRPPVCISLPGGYHWLLDGKSRDGTGWEVTGEEGLWTAKPSILVSNYHGHLNAGVLTDDLDLRTYP